MAFKEVKAEELQFNPFTKIGKEWMLITAGTEEKYNTMTASWGGVGVIWGKDVVTAYIRPQRYTKEFVDAGSSFTLSFFGGREKKAMGHLGSVSGRDESDKIVNAGLHITEVDGQPSFEEAELVLVCRKLYAQEMKPDCFFGSEEIEKWYPDKDFHTMYIAEIVKAYQKN